MSTISVSPNPTITYSLAQLDAGNIKLTVDVLKPGAAQSGTYWTEPMTPDISRIFTEFEAAAQKLLGMGLS